jgi:hypothetical protein
MADESKLGATPTGTTEDEASFVDELAARAVAPYADLLPPEALAEMEAFIGDALATHPALAPLVARLRPRPPQASSAEQPREELRALLAQQPAHGGKKAGSGEDG